MHDAAEDRKVCVDRSIRKFVFAESQIVLERERQRERKRERGRSFGVFPELCEER